jgi:hypothetical protein
MTLPLFFVLLARMEAGRSAAQIAVSRISGMGAVQSSETSAK